MSMRRWLVGSLAFGSCLVCVASPAWAHPGHAGHQFIDGWQHPLTGLDHLLAMVAVGLLGVRLGGKALWAMPATFLLTMLVGGAAAALGMPLPGVEYGIMGSVLVLGLLVALASSVSFWSGIGMVGAFAFFHGHAHAAEMVAGGSFNAYAAGFLLATAVLHASGIAAGMALSRLFDRSAVRLTGAAISALGALMIIGLM